MTRFYLLTSLFLLCLFWACVPRYNPVSAPVPESAKTDTIPWEVLDRLGSCDSVIQFMQQVIVVEQSMPAVRICRVRIPGEGLDMWSDKRYQYYVNADCLVGLSNRELYRIFCFPEHIEDFVAAEAIFYEKGNPFSLVVRFSNGFALTAVVKAGQVDKAQLYQGSMKIH